MVGFNTCTSRFGRLGIDWQVESMTPHTGCCQMILYHQKRQIKKRSNKDLPYIWGCKPEIRNENVFPKGVKT